MRSLNPKYYFYIFFLISNKVQKILDNYSCGTLPMTNKIKVTQKTIAFSVNKIESETMNNLSFFYAQNEVMSASCDNDE